MQLLSGNLDHLIIQRNIFQKHTRNLEYFNNPLQFLKVLYRFVIDIDILSLLYNLLCNDTYLKNTKHYILNVFNKISVKLIEFFS